jgi:hypothetical protein
VGPRAGPDDVENRKFLTGLELRPLGRPAHRHKMFLYRHEKNSRNVLSATDVFSESSYTDLPKLYVDNYISYF